MLSIKAFLQGKVASYYLNAKIDFRLARALVNFVATDNLFLADPHLRRRVKALINSTPKSHRSQRLIVQAYTQRYINGGVDLAYSRLIKKFLGQASSSPVKLNRLIFPWFNLFIGNFSHLASYARNQAGLKLILAPQQIAQEVIRVQFANLAVNQRNAQLIKSGRKTTNFKITRLRRLSQKSSHTRIFLSSAAATQIAAARWDRLLILLLTLRYSIKTTSLSTLQMPPKILSIFLGLAHRSNCHCHQISLQP